MSERQLRRIGAGLFLTSAVACGAQLLIALIWSPTAVAFILVVSGAPALIAGVWVLLPWRRRVFRYVLPMILGVNVAFWNFAILAEGSTGPVLPTGVWIASGVLLATQVVLPLIAIVMLGSAWRVGRKERQTSNLETV